MREFRVSTTKYPTLYTADKLHTVFMKNLSIKSIVIIQSISAYENDLCLHLDTFWGWDFRLVEVVVITSTDSAAMDGDIVSPCTFGIGEGFFQANEIPVRIVVFARSPYSFGRHSGAGAVHAGPLMMAPDDQRHQRSQAWYAGAYYAQARLGRGPDGCVHKVPWSFGQCPIIEQQLSTYM